MTPPLKRPHALPRVPALRSFEEFRDVIATYRLPRILFTALDLDLFTAMGTRAWTIPALAGRLRVSERGLDILCRNLASAGILVKRGRTYRNGPVAAANLNAESADYRRGYINLMRDQWTDWGKLTDSVRRGRPVEDDPHQDEAAYRRGVQLGDASPVDGCGACGGRAGGFERRRNAVGSGRRPRHLRAGVLTPPSHPPRHCGRSRPRARGGA